MNGALYISFFQGQLESALEQVVQLAVTEITSTVGASLSSMLLDTARKEQENQRLMATIHSPSRVEREHGESAEPQSLSLPRHAVPRPASHHDSLRLEEKRRAVGQLKVVMERVWEFAVCELSKIVEDSFDDVLLELRKTEQENEELKEKLCGVVEDSTVCDAALYKSQGDRVGSPNSSVVVKDEERPDKEEQGIEPTQNTEDSAPPTVRSVSQDWVPVLDQVFGQKWCADIWPVKGARDGKVERPCLPSEEPISEQSVPQGNGNSQSDQPQWLQEAEALTVTFDPQQTEASLTGDVQLKSQSMLHRLLTLPSQLLDGDDESMESEEGLLNTITPLHTTQPPHLNPASTEDRDGGKNLKDQDKMDEEEEVQGQETKPRSCRSTRKNQVCKTCGRKFNRAHLLKMHRLTHKEACTPFSKNHTCTNSGKNT